MKKVWMGLGLCVLSVCTSCQNANMNDVVKLLTEQAVDTTGFAARNVELAPFAAVEIDCLADVSFHQTPHGTNSHVRLLAPDELLENIRVNTTSGGVLKIEVDPHFMRTNKDVAVVHVYAPTVNQFVLNGGKCLRLGSVAMQTPVTIELNGVGAVNADALQTPALNVTLDGAGSINLENIDTQRLRAELNGAGNMVLAGKAAKQQITLDGAGYVDTDRLTK